MFYTIFVSASKRHILWLQEGIVNRLKIKGHITKAVTSSVYQLKYAKKESLIILRKMYYKKNLISLSRKRLKIEKVLDILGISL